MRRTRCSNRILFLGLFSLTIAAVSAVSTQPPVQIPTDQYARALGGPVPL